MREAAFQKTSVRRHLCLGLAVCLVLAFGAARADAQTSFGATLEGGQEVTPVTTTAFGSATLTLNAAQNSLVLALHLSGVDLDGNQTPGTSDNVTGLHIHNGAPGVNGGVVFGLIAPADDMDGDFSMDPVTGVVTTTWDGTEGQSTLASQLSSLMSGQLYFNVHTVGNGGGEIRGQILPTVQGVSGQAFRWESRDSPPFDCSVATVGHVYLQRDLVAASGLTHLLCQCVGDDSPLPVTYKWLALDNTTDCAPLFTPG